MNRTQKVMYRNWYSSIGNVQAGVPQGSVLRPLLFLLYVNDVADNMVPYSRLFWRGYDFGLFWRFLKIHQNKNR
jgi:hypothetical protein